METRIADIPAITVEDGYDETLADAISKLREVVSRHETNIEIMMKRGTGRSRLRDFLRENQILLASAVAFIGVIVYCSFNRFAPFGGDNFNAVIDRLTGTCYTPFGQRLHRAR